MDGKEIKDKQLIEVDCYGTNFLNYALVQSNLYFIDRVEVTNHDQNPLANLKLFISFEFDYIETYEKEISLIDPEDTVSLRPDLKVHTKKLFELSGVIEDALTLQILKDDTIIYEWRHSFSVLPLYYWSGAGVLPESIACFVMPNIPEMTALRKRVSHYLEKLTKNPNLTAYFGQDKSHVRAQMAAIYATIQEQEIVYAVPPENFWGLGQEIRTPQKVLQTKEGTCIEMATLFCSLAESCGLNPFLILIKGHAFAGLWLEENFFDHNVVEDISQLTKRLASGVHDLEVIECTTMNAQNRTPFEKSVKIAHETLENEDSFEMLIDIRRSHYFGLRPLPVQVVENGNVKVFDYGMTSEEREQDVSAKSVEEYFLDTSKKENVTKSSIWMRNLLDLSKRNALISFRPGPKNIQLFNSELSQLEDALSGGSTFEIREVVNDWTGSLKRSQLVDVESEKDLIHKISEAEFKAKRLRTFLPKDELSKRLKTIYRTAKISTEENGSSSLFLALGFLRWCDPSEQDEEGNVIFRYAPLVLVPVELTGKASGSYKLSIRDEDSQINITILEFLRQKFDLHITGLNPLPQDESGIDLPLILNSMRKAVMNHTYWDIKEIAVLGNFSFRQFVMWNDLKMRFDQLAENKVVKALVNGRFTDYPEEELNMDHLDREYQISELAIPTDVDSSQLMAVVEAARGTSFVLHGPPGTGKSQTITNMIANALYQGKSVLFVAEKMAALNVVSHRLEKYGMGDFCLEVHSNKTQKRVVLDKLQQNLALKAEEVNGFDRVTEQLKRKKEELNDTVNALHKKQKQGYSVYDMIAVLCECRTMESPYLFSVAWLQTVDQSKWEHVRLLIQNMILTARALNTPISKHPLRMFRKSGYQMTVKDRVQESLDRLIHSLQSFQDGMRDMETNWTNALSNKEILNGIQQFSQTIQERNLKVTITDTLWHLLEDGDVFQAMETLQSDYNRFTSLQESIGQKYTKEIDNFSCATLREEFMQASGSFLFKASKIKKSLQPLNAIAKPPHMIVEQNILNELQEIIAYQEQKAQIDAMVLQLESTLEVDFTRSLDKYDEIFDLYELAKTARSISLSKEGRYECYRMARDLSQHESIQKGLMEYYHILEELERLRELCGVDVTLEQKNWCDKLLYQAQQWKQHIDEWRGWSSFYETVETLQKEGLDEFIDRFFQLAEQDDRILDTLEEDVQIGLAKSFIRYYVEQSTALNKFHGITFNALIDEYQQAIRQYQKLSAEQIRRTLVQNLPNAKTGTNEEAKQLSNLTRIIQSKGRGVSIRQLFQDTSRIIKKLTPCMLMSPLSVAQYIDLDFPKFDLVIFDEASQIRTGIAVGALSRAENAVIVGDPNQMPPTSFFESQTLDEDHLDLEDLDSLLDDCLAVNMPQRHLSCHYRSQSESLISFSNYMYYNNKMLTFPSPEELCSKLSFTKVDGVYDRGKTRTNKKEAQAVVAEIKNRLAAQSADSIGVITFNTTQQNLIDDLLQELFVKHPELEKQALEMHEPIFIKNLENVQGDERDVILFSIAYGPDENGKFYQNFGPLAKKGGWRRLNVAASRARKEMRIYASIDPQSIHINAGSSEGVRGLKTFLEFALKKEMAWKETSTMTTSRVTDGVIQSILDFLSQNGYSAQKYLGSSNFNIPIAVLHPKYPQRFLCAILPDDKGYAKMKTSRDRNVLVWNVLKIKGWDLYRIWALDWLEDQKGQKEKLLAYLNQLCETTQDIPQAETFVAQEFVASTKDEQETSANEKSTEIESNQKEEREEITPSVERFIHETEDSVSKTSINQAEQKEGEMLQEEPLKAAEYRKIEQPKSQQDLSVTLSQIPILEKTSTPMETSVRSIRIPYRVYTSEEQYPATAVHESIRRIVDLAQRIITEEAPICEELLIRRVLESFSGSRLSKGNEEFIRKALHRVKSKKTKQVGMTYYWGEIDVKEYHYYRVPEGEYRREMEWIHKSELANCAKHMVKEHVLQDGIHVDLTNEQLIRLIAHEFGYTRLTEKISDCCKAGIAEALSKKLFTRDKKKFTIE